jgi:hypothetical protein
LAGSNGRQDVRVDVATDAAGELLITYGADGRARRLPYQPVDYDVLLASLAGMGKPMRDFDLREAPDLGPIAPVQSDPELDPLPRSLTAGGKKYRLVIGDTHRHTDISRCGNGRDGSLQDAYRYALNTTGLDWLAISDHDQDILKHRNDKKVRPRTGYDWWRSQKYCDLYTIPGRFVALYGYEHGGSYQARGGHKNIVVAQRGNPVVEVDAPDELFAALAGSGALAIPHQLADGGSRTDWEKWNQEYERVAEIFQARGSYEFEGCPGAFGSASLPPATTVKRTRPGRGFTSTTCRARRRTSPRRPASRERVFSMPCAPDGRSAPPSRYRCKSASATIYRARSSPSAIRPPSKAWSMPRPKSPAWTSSATTVSSSPASPRRPKPG